jgi:hypothetical protein
MGGTRKTVLRIASVAVLVALVAAGCGSSSRPVTSAERGIPRPLASAWAAQASTIAAAAAAGDGCRARRLAGSLRTQVIEAGGKVPARLSVPLLESINSLADRFVCLLPPVTVTTPPAPPPKPKEHHGNGHHDHHGQGNGDQGNQS